MRGAIIGVVDVVKVVERSRSRWSVVLISERFKLVPHGSEARACVSGQLADRPVVFRRLDGDGTGISTCGFQSLRRVLDFFIGTVVGIGTILQFVGNSFKRTSASCVKLRRVRRFNFLLRWPSGRLLPLDVFAMTNLVVIALGCTRCFDVRLREESERCCRNA